MRKEDKEKKKYSVRQDGTIREREKERERALSGVTEGGNTQKKE